MSDHLPSIAWILGVALAAAIGAAFFVREASSTHCAAPASIEGSPPPTQIGYIVWLKRDLPVTSRVVAILQARWLAHHYGLESVSCCVVARWVSPMPSFSTSTTDAATIGRLTCSKLVHHLEYLVPIYSIGAVPDTSRR